MNISRINRKQRKIATGAAGGQKYRKFRVMRGYTQNLTGGRLR